jgi:hypothetical protein
MQITKPAKEFYTEQEAAESLGISIPTLHNLLDEHIFNDGNQRPDHVQFTSSDLILLGFWHELMPNPKVLRMPRRSST